MPVELKSVSKAYGGLPVLTDFSLALPERGTIALLGPSGCGKTTLLRLIAGLEKPDRGQILLPQNTTVSMVFQEDRLLPNLTARGNVLAVLESARESKKGREDQAERILAACGLTGAAHKLPAELSGGMQRRVAVARAIAYGGDLLLLDEPFKGLDPETKAEIIALVFGRHPELTRPALTILVTHDRAEAEQCADRILDLAGPPLTLAGQTRNHPPTTGGEA